MGNKLDSLLKLVQETVEKHSEQEVLEKAAHTLEKLCDKNLPIFGKCDVARSKLLDMITNSYKESLNDYKNLMLGGEKPNEDERFSLITSLKKISIFYNCHDMSRLNIWKGLIENVVTAYHAMIEGLELLLPVEAVKYCIDGCFFGLLWDKMNVLENEDRDDNAEAIEDLKKNLDQFMDICQKLMLNCQEVMLKEQAYLSVCDLLIMFAHGGGPIRNALQYKADQVLPEVLDSFVQEHVFIDDSDEDIDDHQKIEELHKRRNFLASYCKLLVYNVIPAQFAANILKHYVSFYNDYGDIIKATLSKTRENNKTVCAKTMVQSLIYKFNELKEEGDIDRNGEDFQKVKELAKRFALSFGLDAVKNREAVTSLHREGILVAVNPAESVADPAEAPPNLPFLEILTEFTNKLLKQDKKVLLEYLDRRIAGGVPSSRSEVWAPLHMYRNSLVHGEGETMPPPTRKAYHRKRRRSGSDDDDDPDDEDFRL